MAENTTMNAAAYNSKGTKRDPIELPAELFDGTINMPVMHQAVKAYMANQRRQSTFRRHNSPPTPP